LVDSFLAILLWFPVEFCRRRYLLHDTHTDLKWDFHEVGNIVVMLLEWAAFNYFTNGQSRQMLAGRRIVPQRRPPDRMAIDRARARIQGRDSRRRPRLRSIVLG